MPDLAKSYVEHFFPGAMVPETREERIEERSPETVDAPESAFAFRFYDKTEVQLDGDELSGDRRNVSGMFYPEGEVIMNDEILDNPGQYDDTLVANVRINGYDVVETRMGNYQPFEDGDEVI